MPNSYRTPKEGTSDTSRRIAQAVDDEDWQKFRVSLKGQSTRDKLERLKSYRDAVLLKPASPENDREQELRDIRIDNYLKALCRGGQLEPGTHLETMISSNWSHRYIRR